MDRTSQVIGQSGAFLDALERASRAAALDRPVLVIGERGTGKELVAERLHRLSGRWDQPLVVMNCAALPETLIEAELFGHEAGAFTGATKARAGRFEEASGGTLFLDELGTLSMAAQDRLLRAVEYGEVTRIGSSRPLRVDVRIVAATNEHLPDKVAAHQCRAIVLADDFPGTNRDRFLFAAECFVDRPPGTCVTTQAPLHITAVQMAEPPATSASDLKGLIQSQAVEEQGLADGPADRAAIENRA